MINYRMTTDATLIYRETASNCLAPVQRAGDLGNVAAITRDATIIVESPKKARDTFLVSTY